MKFVIFLVCFFIVAGCGTTPNLSGRYPFEVEKISETEYYVEFYGTPLSTVEEALEEWDHKARGVCQGEYQYKKNKTASVCTSSNSTSCIKESTGLLDSGPVVKGVAVCATSDEPKIVYSSLEENKESSELKEILIVKQLETETYFIEFAGLPNGSIEKARTKWHERASITCNGRLYDSKLSKNSMWQADLKASSGSNFGAMGAACALGGAIGCMIASLLSDDSGFSEKDEGRFPVVEGRVFCK